MAIIPENKQWQQPNDGDSRGNIFASYGIDLESNRGTLKISTPLKKCYDETDDADLDGEATQFVEYNNDLYAISDEVFEVSTGPTFTDITSSSNWAQSTGGAPSPGQTDATVFDGLLLIKDGTNIDAYNGTSWSSWWLGTLGQAALSTGDSLLEVGPDGNLYLTDNGNKVYKVDVAGSVSKTGGGTLDFSATKYELISKTKTSTRLYYGTEDTETEDAAIIEWDMGPQSTTANRIHNMGVKRVLCMATWNDIAIAILSDGSIKYQPGGPGTNFTDWPNAQLPETNYPYTDNIIHRNGWAIIDKLPHFLINPSVETDGDALNDDISQNWFYPAGVYCLDPEIGLYCRWPLTDGTSQHRVVSRVGALYAKKHPYTKFFASYLLRDTTTTDRAVIACEDSRKATATKALVNLIPQESVQDILKKLTIVHRQLEDGDSIKVYYRKTDEPSILVSGNWATTTNFHTTDSITGLEKGWYGIVKVGTDSDYTSTVASIDDSSDTVNIITMKDAADVTASDGAVMEFVNFKHMGTVTNKKVEFSDLTIPEPKRSRQVWLMFEITQAAGNNVQIDYLLTE